MESKKFISAFEALAQEHRLAAFRQLVQAGPAGLTPSRLCETLGIPGPTLSFHLAQLRHAGLVSVTRQGRSLTYVAAFETMNQVVGYLTENCCDGAACVPASCAPFATGKKSGGTSNERPVHPKRRA